MNGEAEGEAEEAVRLLLSRLDEFSTEEKVEANGEAAVVELRDGLLDELGLPVVGSIEDDGTFVDSGVRPRREPAT